jgi:hypothetical protein
MLGLGAVAGGLAASVLPMDVPLLTGCAANAALLKFRNGTDIPSISVLQQSCRQGLARVPDQKNRKKSKK